MLNNVLIEFIIMMPYNITEKDSLTNGQKINKKKKLRAALVMPAMIILLLTSVITVINNSANSLLLQPAYADDKLIFKKIKNLSHNSGKSEDPQIAMSGNNVYVVWQDNTPGNFDIFFRRGTS